MARRGIMIMDSPLGKLKIETEGEFLTSVAFTSTNEESVETPECQEVADQLRRYFDGRLKEFDIPVKPLGTEFQLKVWAELQRIPYGETISYSQLAKRLGDVKKIRAAGTANGKNPIAIIIPCHRVIGSNGDLVGYASGVDKKEWLLRHENAAIYQQKELFR